MTIEAALFGVLTKDAEIKTSKAGKSYLRSSVRVENGDKAEFINVMVFDPDAIAAADKLVKGARVYIEGKLSLDEWTAQDGSKRTGLSCMSWHCRLSQIGRNKTQKPKSQVSTDGHLEERVGRDGKSFPRDMHAPLGNGAAPTFNDDIPF
jgi:single-strand DNA-binding protein